MDNPNRSQSELGRRYTEGQNVEFINPRTFFQEKRKPGANPEDHREEQTEVESSQDTLVQNLPWQVVRANETEITIAIPAEFRQSLPPELSPEITMSLEQANDLIRVK